MVSTNDRQRGATAIEYAMVVMLVVTPLTFLVDSIQDGQRDHLIEQGDRVGTPEEEDSLAPYVVSYSGGSGTNGSSGGAISASISLTGTTATQGQKWTAVVEARVVDGAGGPILDASVSGTWLLIYNDGRTSTQSAQCNADSTGACSISLWNLRRVPHNNAIDSVVFTVDNIEAADVTPAPGAVGSSISVDAP